MGLKDDESSAGLTIDDRLLQTLGGLRNDGKILPFPAMEVDNRTLNGIDVAVVQVEPSDNPPVKVDGRCWIRVGPRRAQATAGEERRLTEKNPTLAEAMKTLGFMQRFGIGVQNGAQRIGDKWQPAAQIRHSGYLLLCYNTPEKRTAMKTLAFFNNKGGVGTTSLGLSPRVDVQRTGLSRRRRRLRSASGPERNVSGCKQARIPVGNDERQNDRWQLSLPVQRNGRHRRATSYRES